MVRVSAVRYAADERLPIVPGAIPPSLRGSVALSQLSSDMPTPRTRCHAALTVASYARDCSRVAALHIMCWGPPTVAYRRRACES